MRSRIVTTARTTLRRTGIGLVAAALALGLGMTGAAPASANSDYSSKVTFSGSTYLWSYAYIDSQADSQGCGDYNTWAKIVNASKRVTRIKVASTFRSYGLGSISVGGGTSGTITGSDVTVTWTNTNGATGAYLSGNVCAPFTVVYVGLQAVGTGVYNGTTRTASTAWL